MADTTRMAFFLERLDHPKNAYAKSMIKTWFENSLDYANKMIQTYPKDTCGSSVESLRVLYVCNHMCPNLVHLKRKPVLGVYSLQEYLHMMHEYEYENSQPTLTDNDGKVLREGIHYSNEEFEMLRQYVEGLNQ